jgi:O-succinylbenzoic acid--CoA ligase
VQVVTSGSTGEPKSLLVRKESMLASARLTNSYFGLQAGDPVWLCLSANYIAGKMMIVRAVAGNLTLIVTEPVSTPVISTPVKFAAMVPMQVEALFKSKSGSETFSQIPKLIIGGSAISEALEARIQSLQTVCFATYGMTETVSHIAVRQLNGTQASAAYQALEGVTFEQDERDCLIIHAPHLQDKPFITNDIVSLLSPVSFEWKGRYDHVINTGGIKVIPETLEAKLSPFIHKRFFITALPDEVLGQKIVLVIEGEPFSTRQMQDLQSVFTSRFSRYEKPRQILFVPRFVETSSGKVKRIIPANEA